MAQYSIDWQRGPLKHEKPRLDAAAGKYLHILGDLSQRKETAASHKLLGLLGETQLRSLDILWQWWAGQLRTVERTRQLMNAFHQAADLAEGFDVEDAKVVVCEVLGRKVTMPQDPGCDESQYAKELLRLWIYEFYLEPGDVGADFILCLEQQRSKCQKLALCHRLAHAVFPDMLNGVPRPRRLSESSGVGEPSPPASSPSPWLPTIGGLSTDAASTRNLYPHFLWALDEKKTVETASLSSLPPYLVLSHTWGRWRQKIDGRNVSCDMDGVPWPVPIIKLDSEFDVRKLPERLQKLRQMYSGIRHLWIDLFCIPQDGAAPDLTNIVDKEIGKQASIFRGAAAAVVWFTQIQSWEPLQEATNWFLLDYITRTKLASEEECEKASKRTIHSAIEGVRQPLDQIMSIFNESDSSVPVDYQKAPWEEKLKTMRENQEPLEDIRRFCKRLFKHQVDAIMVLALASMPTFLAESGDPGAQEGSAPISASQQEDDPEFIARFAENDRMLFISDPKSFTGLGTLQAFGPGRWHDASSKIGHDDPYHHHYTATIKPAGWLTGLWTLQEACLVPNMRLLNKDFETPYVGTCGQEVTLGALCSLVDQLDGDVYKINYSRFGFPRSATSTSRDADAVVNIKIESYMKRLPRSAVEVIAALTATGMTQLAEIDAVDLLELGACRQIKEHRGRAIMAAAGITDWFTNAGGPQVLQEREKQLVLDLYPYAFIQEFYAKVGALFFASKSDRLRQAGLDPFLDMVGPTGTMMPFHSGTHTGRWRPANRQDHEAVRTWTISSDGSVNMEKVGILLSTDRPKPGVLCSEIFLPALYSPTGLPQTTTIVDLYELLMIMRGDRPYKTVYAVVLMHNSSWLEGLIICQFGSLAKSKIGNFSIKGDIQRVLPLSEVASWTVE